SSRSRLKIDRLGWVVAVDTPPRNPLRRKSSDNSLSTLKLRFYRGVSWHSVGLSPKRNGNGPGNMEK
ncbi:hypothetical protein GWI33_000487, partial [Rhynchophorus ferrugineus]